MLHSIRKNTLREILEDLLQGIGLQERERQVELCYIYTWDFFLRGFYSVRSLTSLLRPTKNMENSFLPLRSMYYVSQKKLSHKYLFQLGHSICNQSVSYIKPTSHSHSSQTWQFSLFICIFMFCKQVFVISFATGQTFLGRRNFGCGNPFIILACGYVCEVFFQLLIEVEGPVPSLERWGWIVKEIMQLQMRCLFSNPSPTGSGLIPGAGAQHKRNSMFCAFALFWYFFVLQFFGATFENTHRNKDKIQ